MIRICSFLVVVAVVGLASSAFAAGGGYITGDQSASPQVAHQALAPVPNLGAPAPFIPAQSPGTCCPPAQPLQTFAQRPVYVQPARPVVVYRPVMVPPRRVVTYYAPQPVYAPQQVVYQQPYVAARPVVVRTKVYVPWQPIRNTLRWITP